MHLHHYFKVFDFPVRITYVQTPYIKEKYIFNAKRGKRERVFFKKSEIPPVLNSFLDNFLLPPLSPLSPPPFRPSRKFLALVVYSQTISLSSVLSIISVNDVIIFMD